MNTRIINYPHGTFNDWLLDAATVIGKVSEIIMDVQIGGGTEEGDAKLKELAPEIEGLAISYRELMSPNYRARLLETAARIEEAIESDALILLADLPEALRRVAGGAE